MFHVLPGKNTAAESRMFMAKTQLIDSLRKIFQDVAHSMYRVRVCRDHEGIAKRELEVSDFSAHVTYKQRISNSLQSNPRPFILPLQILAFPDSKNTCLSGSSNITIRSSSALLSYSLHGLTSHPGKRSRA